MSAVSVSKRSCRATAAPARIPAGIGSAALSTRLRPLALELATTLYRAADGLAAQLVMKREDLQDLLAEARTRARGIIGQPAIH
jgi:hypothetical protein